jgi:hypothetical protein
MTPIEKPTKEGTYLYKEGNRMVSVQVYFYQDLQSGIARHLSARPIPPQWGHGSSPVWTVAGLQGEWFSMPDKPNMQYSSTSAHTGQDSATAERCQT